MTSNQPIRAGRPVTKREMIIAAAVSVFAEQPYDSASVGDIARRADVAHGLIFYHFKDKRGLYVATVSRLLADLSAFVAPKPEEHSGEEVIRGVLHRYLEFLARYPVTMLSLLRIGLHEPDLRIPYLDAREIGLNRILSALGILCDDPQPRMRMALHGWMGYTDAMFADWLDNDQDLPVDECVDLAVDALVAVVNSAEGYRPEARGLATKVSASA